MVTALQLRPISTEGPITTVESLRTHLYHATQVEISTIPLYLYAAYSIQTRSYSQWSPGISAFRTIRSVVIEEMLHLALARNLLVAVGGGDDFRFADKDFLPTYPSPMLHRMPELTLALEPCTKELVRTVFMGVEQPERSDAPPQPDQYSTIGQFYGAIADGLERLSGPDLWADTHPDLQYAHAYWNQDGGGSPVVVVDLVTALDAINMIVEQGEGAVPGDDTVPLSFGSPTLLEEFSHYEKFRRIAEGIDGIGDVWPVPTNPTVAGYRELVGGDDAPVVRLAELYNAAYCYVLAMIDAIYDSSRKTIRVGAHSPRYGLERTFMSAMSGILYPVADLLVRQPLPDGHHAAPTFEYYDFSGARPKKDELADVCDGLLRDYPSLGGDDGVRQLISLLPSV